VRIWYKSDIIYYYGTKIGRSILACFPWFITAGDIINHCRQNFTISQWPSPELISGVWFLPFFLAFAPSWPGERCNLRKLPRLPSVQGRINNSGAPPQYQCKAGPFSHTRSQDFLRESGVHFSSPQKSTTFL